MFRRVVVDSLFDCRLYHAIDINGDHQFAGMFGIIDQGQRTVDFKMFSLDHVWANHKVQGKLPVKLFKIFLCEVFS